MIKKLFFILIICVMQFFNMVQASETTTLSAGVSLNEQVAPMLMGTWRVASVIIDTDSPVNFRKSGVDIWNLSKSGNVITLSNPFTGATASVSILYVDKKTVRFTKEGNYDRQNLTDTVEITLEGDKFSGKNYLKLVSDDGRKEKNAVYQLRGEKISGTNILER